MRSIKLNPQSMIILLVLLFMVVWWLFINFSGSVDTNSNFLYGAALGILPIIGSFFGFLNSNKWGGTKSSMGKTLVFLSAGLLTWGVGTVVFAYYNIFLQVAVPYPSLADLFYIISWPLWSIGMIYLSRATGVKFQLSNLIGRLALFVIPIIIAGISYYLLIIVARGGPLDLSGGLLKTFFDLAYPIGDIVILTIALLIYGLSFNYLGGFFKWAIVVILFGFVLNYLGDFSFVYTVTKETYFVANWVDLVYTSAFFCLSIGVSLIDPNRFSLGTNNQNHV